MEKRSQSTDCIRYAKSKIKEKTDVPIKDQRLIGESKQLEGNLTLASYNIQKESTLHLMLKLRGSMDSLSRCFDDKCYAIKIYALGQTTDIIK